MRDAGWVGRTLTPILAAASLCGCDVFSDLDLREADAVVVVSGDGQTAPAGTELPEPLVARVLDEDGKAMPRVIVTWAGPGAGSIRPTVDTTDANGLTRARWTLGPSAGTQSMNAAAGIAIATFSATATDP